MKLHIGIANGKTRVSDAATGAVLDWVQSVEVVIDPAGVPWLFLGTSAFDASFAVQSPAPAPAPGTTITMGVDSIQDAVAKVREAGGSVLQDKAPVPTMGWFATCRDTEGNKIGLFENDPNAG